jgi:hypothetical protein
MSQFLSLVKMIIAGQDSFDEKKDQNSRCEFKKLQFLLDKCVDIN